MSGSPLLKPSEKKHQPPPRLSTIVDKKQSRFETLKRVVRDGLQTTFEVGAALLEIREDKLYQSEFASFEAFCESEFKIVRSRAYQLIEAARVKSALPAEMSTMVDNEGQARALAAVPAEKRGEVLEAVAGRGPVTAKAITQVARETKAKAEAKPAERLDKTGYPIPESILEDWREAESLSEVLSQLHRIKLRIEKSVEESDLAFREITNSTVADLENVWRDLQRVIPYAVCTTCQGRTRKNCTLCKQRGWISKFGYEHWPTKAVRELRQKAVQK